MSLPANRVGPIRSKHPFGKENPEIRQKFVCGLTSGICMIHAFYHHCMNDIQCMHEYALEENSRRRRTNRTRDLAPRPAWPGLVSHTHSGRSQERGEAGVDLIDLPGCSYMGNVASVETVPAIIDCGCTPDRGNLRTQLDLKKRRGLIAMR